jgi:hypothetical protein
LKNATENEELGEGDFIAVAKFHRNICHTPNLSGEYFQEASQNTQEAPQNNCRSIEEEVIASNVKRDTVSSETSKEFIFEMNRPIPIDATDLLLTVIYKGQVGNEENGIAIGTQDVSEPTFVTIANNYDLWYLNDAPEAERSWTTWPFPEPISSIYVSFNQKSSIVATIDVMQPKEYARFVYISNAINMDEPALPYRQSLSEGGSMFENPVTILKAFSDNDPLRLRRLGAKVYSMRDVYRSNIIHYVHREIQENSVTLDYCGTHADEAYCHMETLSPTSQQIPLVINF